MTHSPAAAITPRSGQVIQAIIDQAASQGGGEVVIPPGVYLLEDAIGLRSNIHLDGRGQVTLLKAPSVASRLKHGIGYGHYAFHPEEPEKFRPGMGIVIHDDRSAGFHDTTASITSQDGSCFFISRMANDDYNPCHGAMVRSLFPMIEAENVHHASVRGIRLDGQADQSDKLNGCRGGAVFLIQSHDITLHHLAITRYNGEGISFQQCTDVKITHCDINHVTGNGMHPGSGSVRYVITHNRCSHNGGHGIFYCVRTTHSHCAHNVINHNGLSGICIGEYDTHHLIEHNTFQHNAGPAILFRKTADIGGCQTLIQHNTFQANHAQASPHAAEVVMEEPLEDVHLVGNTFRPLPGVACVQPTQPPGRNIRLQDNAFPPDLNPAPTPATPPEGLTPSQLQALVHPAALPLDGARHLNIPQLPAWTEKS